MLEEIRGAVGLEGSSEDLWDEGVQVWLWDHLLQVCLVFILVIWINHTRDLDLENDSYNYDSYEFVG